MNGFSWSLKANTCGCIIHSAGGNQFVQAASTNGIDFVLLVKFVMVEVHALMVRDYINRGYNTKIDVNFICCSNW